MEVIHRDQSILCIPLTTSKEIKGFILRRHPEPFVKKLSLAFFLTQSDFWYVCIHSSYCFTPVMFFFHVPETAHVGAKPSSSLTEEAVSSKIDEASGCGLWTDVCLQCAQSYNVGHALLIILLGQKFASATVDADSIDTMEQVKTCTTPVCLEMSAQYFHVTTTHMATLY